MCVQHSVQVFNLYSVFKTLGSMYFTTVHKVHLAHNLPSTGFCYVAILQTRKCTTLWGEPDGVHAQNMEQLHAFDCHQNVAGYNIQTCCTQAAGSGDDMDRRQHSSHLLLHALPVASIASVRVWSPVTNTGTTSHTNRIDRLPCSYVIALATE